ncbi:hypothetical protein Fcan01_17481 [Folsomia candida]|uniref:BEN domain-containing protein n=1 Tax=Folsomia candida TaxID=158441 RepID=A0A226DS98_FOLCA|nr:hypothetical protein Fcan01_17481 [Folsomia candida]
MTFILIEWSNERPKKYSVVSSEKLEDGTLRANPQNLLGQVVQVIWSRGKIYPGLVVKIANDEEALSDEADLLAMACSAAQAVETGEHSGIKRKNTEIKSKKGNKSTTTKRIRDIEEVVANLVPSADRQDIQSQEESHSSGQEQIPEGGNESVDYSEKYLKMKQKYKALRIKYKDLKSSVREPSEVDIVSIIFVFISVEIYANSGVTLPMADLTSIKMVSSKPTVLARNLFRRIFTTEELSTHSPLWKKCNANSNAAPPLPIIDIPKRDAVIKFVLKEQGLDGLPNSGHAAEDKIFNKNKKVARKEIIKSLSDFLREEQKKARN